MVEDGSFNEAKAAEMLPGRPSGATLKRWRLAGKVPFCRTPGGRIFYTFEQLVEIGAAMKRQSSAPVCARSIPHAPICSDTSGEERIAAE